MIKPDPYVALLVHVIICLGLGLGLVVAGVVLRHRATASRRDKHETYECGEVPFGEAWGKTGAGFYLLALLFILFDAEAAFLFVWALSVSQIGMQGFWGMVVFLGILLLGWGYAWRKGDLSWSR